MASSFQKLWTIPSLQETLLDHLDPADKSSMRLVSAGINEAITPLIFHTVKITFRPSTFTKPVRMVAFDRIGHHVHHLVFQLPHTPDAFLPPLIDPHTGEERNFHYVPQIFPPADAQSRKKDPKYGSQEMTELLTQQYPPLFHASTNIPSFVRAFSAMPSLENLKVSCQGQESAFRYRRCTVDYALVSLRIAVERSPLHRLNQLTLDPIHPGAIYYLRPLGTFGASPAAMRRWRQIKTLTVGMDGWPFDALTSRLDHLKMMQTYLKLFASCLVDFSFTWYSHRGPCPLSLHSEPLMSIASGSDNAASSNKVITPLRFPDLKAFRLCNVIMSSEQVSALVHTHKSTLHTADFADVLLRGSGDWNVALACLTDISGSSRWRERQRPSSTCLAPVAEASPQAETPKTPTRSPIPSEPRANEMLWPTTMCAPIRPYIPVTQLPTRRPPPEAIEVPIIISRGGPIERTPPAPPLPEEMPTPEPWPASIRQDFTLFSPSGSTLTVGSQATFTTASTALSEATSSPARSRSASESTSISALSTNEPPLPAVIATPSPRAPRIASAAPPPLRPRKRLFCEEKDLPLPPPEESPALPTPTPMRSFESHSFRTPTTRPSLGLLAMHPALATAGPSAPDLARLSIRESMHGSPATAIIDLAPVPAPVRSLAPAPGFSSSRRLSRSIPPEPIRQRSSQPRVPVALPLPHLPPHLQPVPSPMILQPSVYVPPSIPARGLAAVTAVAVAVPGTPGRRIVQAGKKVEAVAERRGLWRRCQEERGRRAGSGREKWLGASEAMRDFLRGSVYLWR
ncbi:MAG: hypothetical protein M1814_002176 [Vezdaea aestivalis]|nr:MAG: hypothetical protein M1814_002176 [Vezdaea aestivalis]